MTARPLVLLALFVTAGVAQSQQPSPKPPVTLRSILLEQLRSTHNKAEWFVPINAAVEGLTPEQARWIPKSEATHNPAPADHSVGMLANHLLFWNTQELKKLKGEKPAPFNGNNNETFNTFNATNWPQIVHQLDGVLTDLEALVEHADDAHLQQWASEVAHIGTHNAYHTGQILEIRKLQGSWNPAKGVK